MTESDPGRTADAEYIETHMDEAITTADLARVSRFSPWHSYRLFHQHTGLTPADYIRRLRLSQSALRLKRENCRVIDVAYDLGFGSVDGYQRAFLREFGCNPGAYARQPFPSLSSSPTASNFGHCERSQSTWNRYKAFFFKSSTSRSAR